VESLRASASMRPPTDPVNESADVDVLFATRSLPAMTVLDASVLSVKTMPRADAPKKYVSRPGDVVGKVLAVPVSQGQALSSSLFAEEGGSRQFAAIIPPGKRAVGISVADYSALGSLIYPGSCVDVLFSVKAQDGDWHGAVTKTLIENVQVLAIDDQTVVSPGKTVQQAVGNEMLKGPKHFTLLVDTLQAKTLQMAMQQGTLSLSLRNPMDSTAGDNDTVSVNSVVGGQKPADPFTVMAPQTPQATPVPPKDPSWDMTIIRGTEVNTESFPMPKERTSGSLAASTARGTKGPATRPVR
jgi:pilus assembly protein CpaB